MGKRTVFFSEESFEGTTTEARYWLGFVASYAILRTNKQIEFNFSPDLLPVASGLCRFISINKSPKLFPDCGFAPIYKLIFHPRKAARTIENLGLLSGDLSHDLKMSKDFWRGYSEGRGYFSIVGKYPVAILAFKRLQMREAFCEFVESHTGFKTESLDKLRFSVNGTTAVDVAKLIRGEFESTRLESALSSVISWVPQKIWLEDQNCWVKYALDHAAFSVATPEALYWSGFLMADGSVRPPGAVSLTLAAIDVDHVVKFKEFVKTECDVTLSDHVTNYTPAGQVTKVAGLLVYSKQIFSDLLAYGICPKKSANEDPTPLAWHSRDFWRGMVDGDGTVAVYKTKTGREYPWIKISGSRKLVDCWNLFALQNGLRPSNPNQCKKSPLIWSAYYNGAPAQKIISLLYSNACVSLDRKQAVALKCLEWSPRVRGLACRISADTEREIVSLRSQGVCAEDVALKAGVSVSTVKKYYRVGIQTGG